MDENEYSPEHITAYQLLVINQYQHLNQLFLKLPFTDVPKAGRNLSIFSEYCHRGLKEQKSPKEIVEAFFIDILKLSDRDEQLHMIFLILQFVERQILLFDALEDNAFPSTHRLDGSGSISQIISLLPTKKYRHKVLPIFEKYHAHLVLTAHPTQFYPPQVITILQDLTNAIASNDIDHIQEILLQLGKTSFRHNRQPTPEDEAIFLIDYLKNIFYPAISDIQIVLDKAVGKLPPAVTIGFWPGGDRDGNESVNVNTTLNVAELLHTAIITMYQEELSQLKRRLTFPTLWRQLDKINTRLTNTLNPKNQNTKNSPYKTPEELLSDCQNIRQQLIDNHDSLFLDAIDHWISAITCFGFNFAKIDIRQNSEIHHQTIYEIVMTNKCSDKFPEFKQYHLLDEKNKCDLITRCLSSEMDIQIETKDISDISKDTVLMLQAIPDIQKRNGKEGLHRYIINGQD